MSELPQQVPLHERLVQEVQEKGSIVAHFSPDELHSIFLRQVEIDESDDLPFLLPKFKVKIEQGELHLYAPYTIDADKKPLTFDGKAKNNEKGELEETNPIQVTPQELRERVVEAFEGQLNLPHFIKLITEDALGGEVSVERMFLDGESLGMELKKATESEN